MWKLRVLFAFSLALLGLLLVLAAFKPFATGREYSEVQREGVIQSKNEWIVQFNILNHEGRKVEYTIDILIAGEQYKDKFIIQDGGTYAYIHHVPNGRIGDGKATFTIYKEGSDRPIEQLTYYLN